MSDPHFSKILALAPCSGAGSVITDAGPLGGTFAADWGGPVSYDQNSGDQLFGLNTLEITQALTAVPYRQTLRNLSAVINPDEDLCFEYWFNQTSARNAVGAPRQFLLQSQSAPGVFKGGFLMTASLGANRMRFHENGTRPTTGPDQVRLPPAHVDISTAAGVWNYVAGQYIASERKIYASLNGNFVGSVLSNFVGGVGFMLALPFADSNINYQIRFAQLRVTAANRYGTGAAPVPVAPWPLS